MTKPAIANVLAGRYASADMAELWSAEHKVVLERRLWLAVLRAQADLGVDVVREIQWRRTLPRYRAGTRGWWTDPPASLDRPP